tara:strand:- start:832 stop:1185 length:354 start_codon:yes stop_codon:yes gene_type:complete
MTEQFENELKEMFEKIKPKVIFNSTNYLNILQICFKLIEKLQKKNKEYKKLSSEEKETISKNMSLFIANRSLEHNIIDNDTFTVIKTFIEHKDSIVNFVEIFYNKTCFCIRRKKKIL